MYPRLKEFVKTILSPEFQTVMTFLKEFPEDEDLADKLQYAKTGITKLNKILGIEDYEFRTTDDSENNQIEYESDDDSLISSLLLLKRSKLEDVVKKIVKYQRYSKKKHLDGLSTKIISELSNKNLPIPRLAYLAVRAKSKISTKTVPSFMNSIIY